MSAVPELAITPCVHIELGGPGPDSMKLAPRSELILEFLDWCIAERITPLRGTSGGHAGHHVGVYDLADYPRIRAWLNEHGFDPSHRYVVDYATGREPDEREKAAVVEAAVEVAESDDGLHDCLEWQDITGVRIMDPDGWRHSMALPLTYRITREDFLRRATVSTVREWPDQLLDEIGALPLRPDWRERIDDFVRRQAEAIRAGKDPRTVKAKDSDV